MSNLNKIDVPVAVEHHTKLDLSCDHATTMDFMSLQPINYRHMIKTEHLNMSVDSIVRPMPIEVPFYGMLRQNIRAFFVPYRLVFPNWDSFYNDTIASNYSSSSLVSSPPILPNSSIVGLLESPSYSSIATLPDHDFYDGTNYYKLNKTGRFILKIFRSLGYEPIFSQQAGDFEYNALALLALVKVYVDWYSNSQYLNSVDVLAFERLCKYNDPTSRLVLSTNDLDSLWNLMSHVVYDTDDYFVNAWDNPVSPNSGQYTSFSFSDPTSSSGAFVSTNSLGTPEMRQSVSTSVQIGTTYIHEALKKLTDFQKRHALAGARNIDRVLAQYGVITDSIKQSRSIYVGNLQVNVDIGSVYATADSTDGSNSSSTGDYSGAGFGKGNKTFDFTADEEGIFLVLASIIPSGRIVEGYDRNNRHINKFDFYVPEYDALGVQAIERGEVYVSPEASYCPNPSDYTRVFGFTGRYGEYKRPKSFFTGDISLPNFMAGGRAWSLFRLLGGRWGDVTYCTHSLDFTLGLDSGQYHRVFQYTKGDFNPFYCFFHFNTASYVPCRPLFETYDFDSLSKQVPTENGSKVN